MNLTTHCHKHSLSSSNLQLPRVPLYSHGALLNSHWHPHSYSIWGSYITFSHLLHSHSQFQYLPHYSHSTTALLVLLTLTFAFTLPIITLLPLTLTLAFFPQQSLPQTHSNHDLLLKFPFTLPLKIPFQFTLSPLHNIHNSLPRSRTLQLLLLAGLKHLGYLGQC